MVMGGIVSPTDVVPKDVQPQPIDGVAECFRGLLGQDMPTDSEQNPLSRAIVEGLCDHWELDEQGVVRLYLRC